MTDLLATPGELRAMPGMPDLPDATAWLLLEVATAVVRAATGQWLTFVEGDELEIGLDAQAASEWLHLPEQPVTAVRSVTVDGVRLNAWEYRVQKARARLWRPCGWLGCAHGGRPGLQRRYATQPSIVVVTYDHGYKPGDPRLALAKGAALALAASTVRNARDVQSESIGDYSVAYAQIENELAATPTLEAALKRRYARTRFASIRTTRSEPPSYLDPDPWCHGDADEELDGRL